LTLEGVKTEISHPKYLYPTEYNWISGIKYFLMAKRRAWLWQWPATVDRHVYDMAEFAERNFCVRGMFTSAPLIHFQV